MNIAKRKRQNKLGKNKNNKKKCYKITTQIIKSKQLKDNQK
jgi:hypothetical protein